MYNVDTTTFNMKTHVFNSHSLISVMFTFKNGKKSFSLKLLGVGIIFVVYLLIFHMDNNLSFVTDKIEDPSQKGFFFQFCTSFNFNDVD